MLTSTETNINVDELWQKSGGSNLLGSFSNFQELFDSLSDNESAFELKDTHLRCMDEGTPGGIHLAGSGILYPQASKDLIGKVSGIWFHQDCGAAQLFVEQNKIVTSDPDGVGQEKARELAGALEVPYLGFTPADEIKRPPNFHVARCLYFTGRPFDPSRVKLPIGFQIDPWLVSDVNYPKEEVDIALSIALGSHGFGVKFTPGTPFYLVAVGGRDSKLEVADLVNQLTEVVGNRNNAVIDSIIRK